MKIIKPNRLQSGQNLGVIALSTPAKNLKSEFRERAYARIKKEFGLNIIEAPNLDLQTGHTAGTIKERVKSLHDFFKRKDIHGIMSFWGGSLKRIRKCSLDIPTQPTCCQVSHIKQV